MSAFDEDMARKVALYDLAPHEIIAAEREASEHMARLAARGLSGYELLVTMLMECAEEAGVSAGELLELALEYHDVEERNKS